MAAPCLPVFFLLSNFLLFSFLFLVCLCVGKGGFEYMNEVNPHHCIEGKKEAEIGSGFFKERSCRCCLDEEVREDLKRFL